MRVAALALCLVLNACSDRDRVPSALGGEVESGRLLLRQFGCGSCHAIPGVAAASGRVGPPLDGVASRAYLAGVLPNTPENMATFIRAPKAVDPLTAMPDLGVTETHARHMVAYLYTLR